jgi:hypothetical protein
MNKEKRAKKLRNKLIREYQQRHRGAAARQKKVALKNQPPLEQAAQAWTQEPGTTPEKKEEGTQ